MSERLTAEKALERLYEAATDTPAQPNNADELRETVARRLRTDPEADDREGLVELADEAEAIRDAVHDAVKTYLVEREGWSTSMVAEFLAFFNGYSGAPNLDTFSDRLRDRLQVDQGESDG